MGKTRQVFVFIPGTYIVDHIYHRHRRVRIFVHNDFKAVSEGKFFE